MRIGVIDERRPTSAARVILTEPASIRQGDVTQFAPTSLPMMAREPSVDAHAVGPLKSKITADRHHTTSP